MKCWCGEENLRGFHPDYLQCAFCSTFISKKGLEKDFYAFDTYWHDRQTKKFGFPPIEQRAKDDFGDRIPFWWNRLKTLPKLTSILEVGSAHGGFLRHCKDNGFTICVGVEISEETCSFARKTFDVDMVCGEFPNMQMDGLFDIVCGFDVLEHLPDPIKALEKMKSLGTYIMIQTPCYRNEGLSFPHFQADEHVFIFTEKSVKLLFRTVGITILSSVKGAFPNDIFLVGESL